MTSVSTAPTHIPGQTAPVAHAAPGAHVPVRTATPPPGVRADTAPRSVDRASADGSRTAKIDPVRLAGALAHAWLEVKAGRRPLVQLAPFISPAVRRRLIAQMPVRAPERTRSPSRLCRVIAFAPTADVREVVALVTQPRGTTAIAIRMERHRGAWRAVELTAPEAGLAPLSTASLPADHRDRDAFDEVLEDPLLDAPILGDDLGDEADGDHADVSPFDDPSLDAVG